jgi:hypothetical protein
MGDGLIRRECCWIDLPRRTAPDHPADRRDLAVICAD